MNNKMAGPFNTSIKSLVRLDHKWKIIICQLDHTHNIQSHTSTPGGLNNLIRWITTWTNSPSDKMCVVSRESHNIDYSHWTPILIYFGTSHLSRYLNVPASSISRLSHVSKDLLNSRRCRWAGKKPRASLQELGVCSLLLFYLWRGSWHQRRREAGLMATTRSRLWWRYDVGRHLQPHQQPSRCAEPRGEHARQPLVTVISRLVSISNVRRPPQVWSLLSYNRRKFYCWKLRAEEIHIDEESAVKLFNFKGFAVFVKREK